MIITKELADILNDIVISRAQVDDSLARLRSNIEVIEEEIETGDVLLNFDFVNRLHLETVGLNAVYDRAIDRFWENAPMQSANSLLKYCASVKSNKRFAEGDEVL